MHRLFRSFVALAAIAIVTVGLAVTAGATSGAHFMPATGSSVNDTGGLVVTIDEAGVGNQTVNYTLHIDAVADYGCLNGGGNHPKASNKETIVSHTDSAFSEQPKNGRVQTSFVAAGTPPSAGGFTCPSGQTLVLADVSYTALLTDTTNGVSIDLSASRTFFQFGKN
jgi:hypothetical protein